MGTGGGAGLGPSMRGSSGDRAVDAQDRAVDSKIKSICKGC
jgi:hypothetical protein